MAFVTADRVRDTSTTAGSGSFSVSGTAPTGYRTFSAVLSVSDTFYYSIQHQTLNEWEVGLGTYTSANTFSRTTIYSSSNAGSAVTFSAGTKDVFITMAAARSPQLNASGNVTALGTPVSATLTNATGLPLTTGVTGVLPFANGGSLAWQSVQTGNFTAVAGNAYPVNTTSGAVTVTLPASPTAGQQIIITDYASTFSTNKCTVNPNGNKINAATGNVSLTSSSESIALVYIDATRGWIPYLGFLSSPLTYSVSYLVVAGGGGSANLSGGGGAGGALANTTLLTSGTTYSITVGAGGTGSSSIVAGTSGSNSVLGSIATAIGGGGGGLFNVTGSGGSGGSGGGGAGGVGAGTSTGGAGTTGQGNAGGVGLFNNGDAPSGGGGGASAVGGSASGTAAGAGGAGTASSITGSSVTYAGGGGGCGRPGGSGGSGGGGAGGSVSGTQTGTAGTVNTGGGAGAGWNAAGAAGGSGVVILSVPTANYTGTTTGSPTVTTSGSNTIIKFTASGSYTA